MFLTFADAVEHVIGYSGGGPSDEIVRDSKRAVLDAYRDLANAHNWSYLYRHGRIVTSPQYDGIDPTTGVTVATLAYTHTGGTYERMVTLTGDVWPSWAAAGYLRVGYETWRVAERKSATILTLDAEVNPGFDVAGGTGFILYQDTYLLPADFIAQDQSLYQQNFGGMTYTHPREWLFDSRYVFAQGIPRCYTITGDPQYPGRLVTRVYPFPVEAKSIDFVYRRRPRPLALYLANAGTVGLTLGANLVTGMGTTFTPAMVGSVLRVGADSRPPTSVVGKNPAAFESVITTYLGATQVNVADPAPFTATGVAYAVSDPIDIEPGAMQNAFARAGEMNMGMIRVLKDKPSARQQYLAALEQARGADSRSFAGRSVGPQNAIHRIRFRDMPGYPNVPDA